MTMPKAKMTKKQKVQNFILKNPEAGPAEIAKKLGVASTYAGSIRRELAETHPLPALKRGRKAKATTKATPQKPKPKTNEVLEAQRAAWEEFEADMLIKEATAGTAPNFFRRVLTALGLR